MNEQRCTECSRLKSDTIHDDENPLGHFFSTQPAVVGSEMVSPGITSLAARSMAKIPISKPQRSGGVLDYKWWARSYIKQRLIRDMAREKIEAFFAGQIEVSDEERDAIESMYRELSKQLERRKRVPENAG